MYVFIDTETTGLPDDFNSLSSYNNVRLVQIAWIIYDSYGKKISKRDFIIKPEGFEIPENSTKIHKISNSLALIAGKSLYKVLLDFNTAIKSCSRIVAHNLNYDFNVLLSEYNRTNIDPKINSLNKICTMKATTDYCAISTFKGYKWPSLAELYKKIFLEDMKEAHNAAVDIEATAKCFWHMKKHNLVNFEKHVIHIIKDGTFKNSQPGSVAPEDLIIDIELEARKAKQPAVREKISLELTKKNIKRNNMNLKENAISLRSSVRRVKRSVSTDY